MDRSSCDRIVSGIKEAQNTGYDVADFDSERMQYFWRGFV